MARLLLRVMFAGFVVFLYGPILTIVILAFGGPQSGLTFPMRGTSLHWFGQLFRTPSVGHLAASPRRTGLLALMVAAVTVSAALAAGLGFRRDRFVILAPDPRHPRRSQAENPLNDLSEFSRPSLTTEAGQDHSTSRSTTGAGVASAFAANSDLAQRGQGQHRGARGRGRIAADQVKAIGAHGDVFTSGKIGMQVIYGYVPKLTFKWAIVPLPHSAPKNISGRAYPQTLQATQTPTSEQTWTLFKWMIVPANAARFPLSAHYAVSPVVGASDLAKKAYLDQVGVDPSAFQAMADRAGLEAGGVEVCAVWAFEPTGAIAVLVGPEGQRTMATQRGASVGLGPDDLEETWFHDVHLIHVPAYSLFVEPLAAATRAAITVVRERGGMRGVDLSSVAGLREYGPARMAYVLARLKPEVLFATKAEAETIGVPLEHLAQVPVVKLGPAGCMVFGRHVEAPRVEVVDSTGAGDAFAAAFCARAHQQSRAK